MIFSNLSAKLTKLKAIQASLKVILQRVGLVAELPGDVVEALKRNQSIVLALDGVPEGFPEVHPDRAPARPLTLEKLVLSVRVVKYLNHFLQK